MKILQVNKFYYLKGGSERYFFDLIDLLEKHNHQVIPFSMKDGKNRPSDYEKYFVNQIDFTKREGLLKGIKKAGHIIYSFEAKKKIEKLIKKEKPDLVHLHNFAHQISPSIFSAFKKYKMPVIQTLHDYKLICPNYRLFTKGKICEKCKKHKYYQAVLNKCMKDSLGPSLVVSLEMYLHRCLKDYANQIDLFISPSKFLKNKLVEWGIDKNKIVHLPNFVNLEEFGEFQNHPLIPSLERRGNHPLIPSLERRGNHPLIPSLERRGKRGGYLPGDQVSTCKNNYILYFGRLSKEKGVNVLINSMRYVKKGVKLKVVGKGPEIDNYKFLISNYKLNDRIELVGYKTGDELYYLINQSMFVVLPSQWYENFPYSVLEAFALGKPVIGSNLGGIPELVKNKETGLLFEPGDERDLAKKINWLFNNKKEIIKMGEKAREKIEKELSPEMHYQKLAEVYKKIKDKK